MSPSPPPARQGRRSQDRHVLTTGAWLVAALAVIGGSLFAGSLVFSDDGAASSTGTPSIQPLTPSSSPSTSAPSPSPSPTSSSPTPKKPTATTMKAFVRDYLSAVTDDPAGAWSRLTPGFQRTSGGFSDYREFWAPISQATTSNLEADVSERTVSYDVRYTYADGHTTTDSTRLTLRYDNGTYAIAGEG